MRQTLFYIPNELFGLPVFGTGLLLALCVVGGVLLMGYLAWRQGFNADTLGYLPLLAVLGFIVWFILPRVCEPQGLPIRGYGTMLLVAVLSAIGMNVWRGRRLGLDPDMIVMVCFWMIVPGILGARLFYVIQKWDQEFLQPTLAATLGELINFTQGGLVVYGSLIGGALGLFVFIARHKLPPLATFDLIAPSIMLGLAIGRLGCFLNGCCFGGVCDLPWAVEFPENSPAHYHQYRHDTIYLHGLQLAGPVDAPPVITDVEAGSAAEQQGLRPGDTLVMINGLGVSSIGAAEQVLFHARTLGGELTAQTTEGRTARWAADEHVHLPVHPTQIYSSINALFLCLLLLAYAPFRRRDGEVFALLLTIYPVTRFVLEIIRNDEGAIFGTGLTISQNVSLLLLVAAAGLWTYVLTRPVGTALPKFEAAA